MAPFCEFVTAATLGCGEGEREGRDFGGEAKVALYRTKGRKGLNLGRVDNCGYHQLMEVAPGCIPSKPFDCMGLIVYEGVN